MHDPPAPYVPPQLDADHLARMRAPPEKTGLDLEDLAIDSSGDEADESPPPERSTGYF